MKDSLTNIKKILEGIHFGNKVSIFFLLLMAYYILNLFTSDINSGMSGGMEAEHNIVNQVMASLVTVFAIYHSISTPAKPSYTLVNVTAFFLIYLTIRYYFGFINSYHNNITFFSGLVHMVFWGGGLIFSMNCFRFATPKDIQKLIRMMILVYLVFALYRLFTQKEIITRIGISAGVNAVSGAFMIAPLVLMAFRGKMRIVLFIVCGFICVYSAKRQSAAGMAIITFFNLKLIYKSYFHKRKILAAFSLIVVLFFGSSYIYKVFDDLNRRQEIRSEKEDVDSGRALLWKAALDGFERSDNSTKWVGGGPGAGRKYIGEYYPIARAPHNGFIQVLCDYGYIGLFLYSLFFLVLLGYVVKVKGMDNKLLYLSICFAWIFKNVISHPGGLTLIFLSIGVGYIFYRQNKEGNTELV